MTTKTVSPRVYVASLSDYNAGRLVGAWLDATDLDTLTEGVTAMLATSMEPVAEEYAIHDYEGFPAGSIGEYTPLEEVATLAAFLDEHGEAGAVALSAACGRLDEAEAKMDNYRGVYRNRADYVESEYEENGLAAELPDWVKDHVDYDSIAHDWACDGELHLYDAAEGGYHVFTGYN